MKYFLFALTAFGVPPLTYLLTTNTRLMRYVVYAIMLALCKFQSTAINFFSHEDYHGSARGMEVSLIYLLSLTFIFVGIAKGKLRRMFPEAGYRLYALYFLLCLPSLANAEDRLISWLEIWKMMMVFVVYLAVYAYLRTTNDFKTIIKAFLLVIILNFFPVLDQHYFSARYQAHGLFPHWNCMAMALHLFGTILFARFLTHGTRTLFDKVCFVGFCIAILSTLWSYSRGAFLVMPISYGLTALACFIFTDKKIFFRRMIPIAAVAAIGIVIIMPRVIARFVHAPQASTDTRVELAHCAWEMIKDKPMLGVGINNWSLKMDRENYPYQTMASDTMGYELTYKGIVETVYLLVGAECGIPALIAMVIWFLWYLYLCVRLLGRLRGTPWFFIPAGLLGGLTANYIQSILEWVLRQQMNLVCLVFMFATLAYLNTDWKRLVNSVDRKSP